MEKKRKLPARAAARSEQATKKRMSKGGAAVQVGRSETPVAATPTPAPDPAPAPEEELPPPLPKSITAGKPLPTVDVPQPDDLSTKDYQSVSESGVLADSLTRSRQKWISESIFEKYWSKPVKRKGVVIEEPNNPPKDSMVKLGQVTITVEPHVFEATMFAVKDPKPPAPLPAARPVLQYGPPNGVMPPPPTPKRSPSEATVTPAQTPAPKPAVLPATATPIPSPKPTPVQASVQSQAPTPQAQPPLPAQSLPAAHDIVQPLPTVIGVPARPPASSPRGMEAILSAPAPPAQQPVGAAPGAVAPPMRPPTATPTPTPTNAAHAPPPPNPPRPVVAPAQANTTPAQPKAPGTDPIILALAGRATDDPQLRDLMKKVATGEATKPELERFQVIIDAITAESKRNGVPVGPSADRLVVDGRTVRYFADEVRAILDIVLTSNPKQTSVDLRPPTGSDPLVVALVKAALDDAKKSDLVRRISTEKPRFSDASDLKTILDTLKRGLVKERGQQQKASQVQSPQPSPAAATPKTNGTTNGQVRPSPAPSTSAATPSAPVPQALRSKGPPPPPKHDYSAVVFEFHGGSGDRFLFPKFSVVEYVPTPSGHQVIASFLLVRKGSQAEYPMADPELDYYQPLTIRLFTPVGRHLENLARVVAPQEEVQRYMDDVMDKMTKAEYVLLAMQLPRNDAKDGEGAADEKEKEKEPEQVEPKQAAPEKPVPPPTAVLWGKATRPEIVREPSKSKMSRVMDMDAQYQSFVKSVSRKETSEA
ncbi:hypothetical protein QBC39DRAFT_117654 [Podospora conica]|nr:hypothetical protein QBC39DRAFT_117654 [Schizothecium conicum]